MPPDPFCQVCVLPRQTAARKGQVLCQLQPGAPAQSPSARVCTSRPLFFGHGPHSCSVSTVNCLYFCLAWKSLTCSLFLTHPRAASAASLLASTPASLASEWARAGNQSQAGERGDEGIKGIVPILEQIVGPVSPCSYPLHIRSTPHFCSMHPY